MWGVNQATYAELDDGLDSRGDGAHRAPPVRRARRRRRRAGHVGSAVLRGLRASRRCGGASSPPRPGRARSRCPARADQNANDLSTLIDLATTLDWPWANLSASALPDCVDARLSSPQVAAVTAALSGYARSAWIGHRSDQSGLVAGGEHRGPGRHRARRDRRASPTSAGPRLTPPKQALLDLAAAMVDTLTGVGLRLPGATTSGFAAVPTARCSEYGSILIQLSTHRGWMIHQFHAADLRAIFGDVRSTAPPGHLARAEVHYERFAYTGWWQRRSDCVPSSRAPLAYQNRSSDRAPVTTEGRLAATRRQARHRCSLEHTCRSRSTRPVTCRGLRRAAVQNPFDHKIEGGLPVPAADGAAVNDLEIQIGDRIIPGEIAKRADARRPTSRRRRRGSSPRCSRRSGPICSRSTSRTSSRTR